VQHSGVDEMGSGKKQLSSGLIIAWQGAFWFWK
jgi:hypothetical protein